MATDQFLKIDDVKGEAQDAKHTNEIDVLAWSWTMTNKTSFAGGGGGGAGKVDVGDLLITKTVDKASPVLIQACCDGTHFKTAMLTVRKAGKNPVEYWKLKLEDVVISSVSPQGGKDDERPVETLSLAFGKVSVEYTPQKADGSSDPSVKSGWDVKRNVKL